MANHFLEGEGVGWAISNKKFLHSKNCHGKILQGEPWGQKN